MIRFHVHVTTLDLASSIRTYSQIFGPPAVEKPDYAKWEPDGFPVIFAVSTRKGVAGIDHRASRRIRRRSSPPCAPVSRRRGSSTSSSATPSAATCAPTSCG